MPFPRRVRARPLVPRAPVLARPPQHLQVASLRRGRARPPVPRTPVLMRPPQHLQVASQRRPFARVRVPRAPVLTRPLEHLKVASRRRGRARPPVPRAPVPTRPPQDLEVAIPRRVRARRSGDHARVRHALDRLAARPSRHRERRLEPPEMVHHGVEDLGGELAEERPEDVVVVGNRGDDGVVHLFRATRRATRGRKVVASVVAPRASTARSRTKYMSPQVPTRFSTPVTLWPRRTPGPARELPLSAGAGA